MISKYSKITEKYILEVILLSNFNILEKSYFFKGELFYLRTMS